MATAKVTVRLTSNFEANLALIEAFWAERNAPQAYAALLDSLAGSVIGNLEDHPRIGRPFFERSGQSVEARARIASLMERFDVAEVREYLWRDYLLLYAFAMPAGARSSLAIHLLTIKHHRQLSFDFEGLWPSGGGGAER